HDHTDGGHTAEALREFAAKSRDGTQVRRLLAIALILEGRSRTEAAELSEMDHQARRDWVLQYRRDRRPDVARQLGPTARSQRTLRSDAGFHFSFYNSPFAQPMR